LAYTQKGHSQKLQLTDWGVYARGLMGAPCGLFMRFLMNGSQDKYRFFSSTSLEPSGSLRVIVLSTMFMSDSLGKPDT